MSKINEEQLKEIASKLESGESCYIRAKTAALAFFPEEGFDAESRFYKENYGKDAVFTEIVDYPQRYDALHPMPPSDSFEVMKRFLAIEGLDRNLRKKLGLELRKSHPFARFKKVLQEKGGIELQAWYRFKSEQYELWTKLSLESMNWH